MADFKVGDVVHVVLTLNRKTPDCYDATVTKVGRKWVTASGDRWPSEIRFDPETGRIDGRGFSPPGRVYRSAADYQREATGDRVWAALRQALPYSRPASVTAENVYAAAQLLGLRTLTDN